MVWSSLSKKVVFTAAARRAAVVIKSRSLFLFFFVCQFVSLSVCHVTFSRRRRRQASYDVARLLLMAPIDPWRNSAPDFGAVAFCATNIEDFRTSLTPTSLPISSTYSSQKRS